MQVYYRGKEEQLLEMGFNLATGYHKTSKIHVLVNSTKVFSDVTDKATTNFEEFSPENKKMINSLVEKKLAYFKN